MAEHQKIHPVDLDAAKPSAPSPPQIRPPAPTTTTSRLHWLAAPYAVPTRRKTSVSLLQDYKEMDERKWQYAVPYDILSHISDFLPLQDFITFRSICRSWRKAPSFRFNITEFSKDDAWCIFYDFDTEDRDKCLFYQCGNKKRCGVRLPNLRGATCIVSKSGWLLIRRRHDYLFFNPFTLAEVVLPQYPRALDDTACQLGTFSSPPTSRYCKTILISSRNASTLEIGRCYLTDEKWVVDTVNVSSVGDVSIDKLLCNPKAVYICACDGYMSCSCLEKAAIFICYDRHWVKYDYENNVLQTGERKSSEYVDWHSKMRDAHLDDWLRIFGKDFTFCFSLFNESEETSWGHMYYHLDDSHSKLWGFRASKTSIVKAAWIQPGITKEFERNEKL